MNEISRLTCDWCYLEAMYLGALQYSLNHAKGYAISANRIRERMLSMTPKMEQIPDFIDVPTAYPTDDGSTEMM